MRAKYVICFCISVLFSWVAVAQDEFIYTKEGFEILKSREFISNCLRSLKKDKTDAIALAICQCQVQKIDRRFTRRQYKDFTSKRVIDLAGLIKEDSVFEKEIQNCYGNSGVTALFKAESFQSDFIKDCMEGIIKNTEKKLDSNKLRLFCSCQLDLIKIKKLTDNELQAVSDPNSLLFFEIMYKCGNPFLEDEDYERNWNEKSLFDITGPESDTIKTLSLNGMTYIKLKTGSLIQVWLFDTGASDLVINSDMEDQLKKENIISTQNYLGIGEYEMANGMIDTCRKYRINNIQIGQFTVSNIVVAASDKTRRIIVGKSLLNKFSYWSMNNRLNQLILVK